MSSPVLCRDATSYLKVAGAEGEYRIDTSCQSYSPLAVAVGGSPSPSALLCLRPCAPAPPRVPFLSRSSVSLICTPLILASCRFCFSASIFLARSASNFAFLCSSCEFSTPSPAHSPQPYLISTLATFLPTCPSISSYFYCSNSSRASSS